MCLPEDLGPPTVEGPDWLPEIDLSRVPNDLVRSPARPTNGDRQLRLIGMTLSGHGSVDSWIGSQVPA